MDEFGKRSLVITRNFVASNCITGGLEWSFFYDEEEEDVSGFLQYPMKKGCFSTLLRAGVDNEILK